jgi:hypothetical protein
MKSSGPTIVKLATILAISAQAQSADKDKLDAVDRNFVCPESQPDDATRKGAVKQFLLEVGEAWPGVTIGQMIQFRVALLNKHNCTKTLEAIRRQDRGG